MTSERRRARIALFEELAAEFTPTSDQTSPTARSLCAELATLFYQRAAEERKELAREEKDEARQKETPQGNP